MKTLNTYVTKSFLVTFGMAIAVLTFGMLGARLIKVFEYLSKGVPIGTAFTFILFVIPIVLSLAIPWATLVAVMLVFGRLSADNEITAMRACGISILQIISPLIIIAFLFTCVCLYLQVQVGPQYLGQARHLVKKVAIDQPMALIDPGLPIEFENNHIYVGDKTGENNIEDVQIYRVDKKSGKLEQDIRASKGKIEVDKHNQVLKVILYNATVISYDKQQNATRTFSKQMTFPIDYGEEFNRIKIGKRTKYLSFKEIFARIILEKKRGKNTVELEVELNQRLALALSPIAFLLLGMPLAIRTSRRETSVGLFLSVVLAGVYFFSVMIFNSLTSRPGLHPEALLWIPNIIYQVGGTALIFRIACR